MATSAVPIPMIPLATLSPVEELPVWLRPFDSPLIAQARMKLLKWVTTSAAVLLFASTWRLWTPQVLFPQVPLFGWGLKVPFAFDWIGAAGIVLSLLVALFAGQGSLVASVALATFFASLTGMICLDQHRAQPWAYQFLLVALVLTALPARRALAWLRILTIGIYLHSALSKVDLSFCETLGPGFVQVLLQPFGLSVQSWSLAARRAAVLIFPAGEFLIVVGLTLQRTRTIALAGAVLMHLTMLWVLGPWGLDHKPGVLIWNIYFIVQDCILFAPAGADFAARTGAGIAAALRIRSPLRSIAAWGVQLLIAAAVLLPFLEPWGGIDHWPAWGLYASRVERTVVLIEDTSLTKIPDSLRSFLEPTHPATAWWRLRLDLWSLEELAAPLYPQHRFQIGVAAAVAERYRLQEGIQVILESPADRWSGVRSRQSIVGELRLAEACNRFRFNAHPRNNLQ